MGNPKDNTENAVKMLPIQINDRLVEMLKEERKVKKANREKEKQLHEDFWSSIHEDYPELDKDKNYSCDLEYIETGVVFLKESSLDACGVGLAKAFLSAISDK